MLDDNSLMPWGKYKGKKMVDVPAEYLLYWYDDGKLTGDLLEYVKDNLQGLRVEAKKAQGIPTKNW